MSDKPETKGDAPKSWGKFGRRFVVRLSYAKPEMKALMDEYDRRSQLIGAEDKAFLRECMLVGFKALCGEKSNGITAHQNKSNYEYTDGGKLRESNGSQAASDDESRRPVAEASAQEKAPESPRQPVETAPASDQPAIKASSLLGGLMQHGGG